jgi:hypothetical protein
MQLQYLRMYYIQLAVSKEKKDDCQGTSKVTLKEPSRAT